MTKKSSFIDYFKTFIITLFILSIVGTGSLFFARFNAEHHLMEEDLVIEKDMVGYLISKYKHQEEQEPHNAYINLKLGQMYELLGAYIQAQNEYVKALEKRNGYYSEASFALASVYLINKEYAQAEKIVKRINDSPKYSIIFAKGKFYKEYGNALFNEANYDEAIECYDKALFYLKKISSPSLKEVEQLKNETYVALADNYATRGKIEEAISLLSYVYEKEKNSVVAYKLGLLNLEKAPELSVEFFEYVQSKEPSIINFDIYKRLLFELKLQYASLGEDIKSKLYDAKLSRLKSYINRNILSQEELIFSKFNFSVKKFLIRNEYDIIYEFQLENRTGNDISKLYAIVDFYNKKGNKIYTKTQDIAPFGIGFASKTVPVKIVLRTKKNIISQYDDLELKLYLSKNPKVYKLLYSINSINVTKVKKNN